MGAIPGLNVISSKLSGLPDSGSLIKGLVPNLTLPNIVPPIIPVETKKEIKEEKPSGDKSEYGSIQVFENKGGFVEIRDETPGNVRMVNLHPTGTYDSMLDNGDVIRKTTRNVVDMVDKDWQIKIEENYIIIVAGNTKIEIRKDKLENIQGNNDVNIDKESKTKVGGDVSEEYESNYSRKVTQDSAVYIQGNSSEGIDGNLEETIKGNHSEKVQGNLTIKVTGNVTVTGNNVNVNAKNTCSITAKKVKIN